MTIPNIKSILQLCLQLGTHGVEFTQKLLHLKFTLVPRFVKFAHVGQVVKFIHNIQS